jgi:hypothetical protein
MQGCSITLFIKEIQIKATIRYHFTLLDDYNQQALERKLASTCILGGT